MLTHDVIMENSYEILFTPTTAPGARVLSAYDRLHNQQPAASALTGAVAPDAPTRIADNTTRIQKKNKVHYSRSELSNEK